MAFSELQASRKVRFNAGAAELDAGKVQTQRKRDDGMKVHQGRVLVFKDRTTKEWSCFPLPDRIIEKSKRGGVTERKAEVAVEIKKRFKEGSVMASDASPAFKSVNKDLNKTTRGIPAITANHSSKPKKTFVTTVRVKVKDMAPKLKKLVVKKPSARIVRMAGGDNAVEGLIGTGKKGMDRQNMRGRRTGKKSHINFLASLWQLRHPGLAGVLKALQVHRESLQDTTDPKHFYEYQDWLGEVEPTK